MYHLDFESYSPVDIKLGPNRYAEHPEAEILCLAVAKDNGAPLLWTNPRHRKPDPRAVQMLHEMVASGEKIVAHNALFEFALLNRLFHRDTGVRWPRDAVHLRSRMVCTAVMARRAGFPSKLEKVAEALELKHRKDPKGRAAIRTLCVPQKDGRRILPAEDPATFDTLCHYCVQDVRVEQEIHRKLEYFTPTGAHLEAYWFDILLNTRGLPVNVAALRHAQKIVDTVMDRVGKQFLKWTGLMPTQNKRCKEWFHAHGLKLPNLQVDTIEEWRPKCPPKVLPMLDAYSTLQFAAVKKITTMLDCAGEDGWIRDLFRFHGAGTGRWSGERVQPQNFKRPTIKDTDRAYALICEGCTADDLDLLWGNALDVLSSCIRNFIHCVGTELYDADYAAIEARIVNWLAGQEDVLQEFRNGRDSYRAMSAEIYGCSYDDIKNPSYEREVGKRAVLGCGYKMGSKTFKDQCWVQYGLEVSEELAERAVEAYRRKHYKVKALWDLTGRAARAAVENPGNRYGAGKYLSFVVKTIRDIPYLLMRLPSGRELAYPRPAIEEMADKFGRVREQITFYGQLHGKQICGRISTYDGKLVENATQAVAMDIMANGACLAETRGFPVVALIHDQALALRRPHTRLEDYVAALTELPAWAAGLPIKAEGKIQPYYRKG